MSRSRRRLRWAVLLAAPIAFGGLTAGPADAEVSVCGYVDYNLTGSPGSAPVLPRCATCPEGQSDGPNRVGGSTAPWVEEYVCVTVTDV